MTKMPIGKQLLCNVHTLHCGIHTARKQYHDLRPTKQHGWNITYMSRIQNICSRILSSGHKNEMNLFWRAKKIFFKA